MVKRNIVITNPLMYEIKDLNRETIVVLLKVVLELTYHATINNY